MKGWLASLALHGLLGGVVVWYAASPSPELPVETLPHWNVALVELPAPSAVPAAAGKLPAAQPQVVQRVITAPRLLTNTSLLALPVNPKIDSAVVTPIPLVAEQGMVDEPLVMAPVVAGTPESAAVNAAELAGLLWQRMETLKRYPELARRNGWEGTVLIRVVLGGDGRLVNADIQRSSGYAALDQSALQVLRAATPLQNDVASAAQQHAEFMLPVPYRLQH